MINFQKGLKEFEGGEKNCSPELKEARLRYFDAVSSLTEIFILSFEKKFLEHLDDHRKEFFEIFKLMTEMMEVAFQ